MRKLYCGGEIRVRVSLCLGVFLLNVVKCVFFKIVWFSLFIFKGFIIMWGFWLLIGVKIIWKVWFLIVLFDKFDIENLNCMYLGLVLSFKLGDLKMIFLCCSWSWLNFNIFVFVFERRIFLVDLFLFRLLLIKLGFFVMKNRSLLLLEFLFV